MVENGLMVPPNVSASLSVYDTWHDKLQEIRQRSTGRAASVGQNAGQYFASQAGESAGGSRSQCFWLYRPMPDFRVRHDLVDTLVINTANHFHHPASRPLIHDQWWKNNQASVEPSAVRRIGDRSSASDALRQIVHMPNDSKFVNAPIALSLAFSILQRTGFSSRRQRSHHISRIVNSIASAGSIASVDFTMWDSIFRNVKMPDGR